MDEMLEYGKRCRSTPTGSTPVQKEKHVRATSARSLFPNYNDPWQSNEVRKLVEFIGIADSTLTSCNEHQWPSSKNRSFWQECAEFISKEAGTVQRSADYGGSFQSGFLAAS